MEQLNKTPTSGKFGDVAKVLDTNFGLIVSKMLELEESHKDLNCGFYSSETALKTAYPNPELGMMAYVGSGTDYIVYRCTSGGTWTKTDETFKIDITVDLSTFATKEALQAVSDEVDTLMLGAIYGGMATTITNPGTPKTKIFYLPTEAGTYTNFGSISVSANEVAFLYYDGSTWAKHTLDLSSTISSIQTSVDTASINAKNALEKANTAVTSAQAATDAAATNKEAIATANTRIDDVETTVSGLVIPKIVTLTEAEYEALELKDTDTYYMTTEE